MSSWWPSASVGLLDVWSALDDLVDVDEELQEVLSDEVFNELVVINQFLVVYLGSALKLHFFRVILPLDLDVNESETHQLQHLKWFTLELDTDVKGTWLQRVVRL